MQNAELTIAFHYFKRYIRPADTIILHFAF